MEYPYVLPIPCICACSDIEMTVCNRGVAGNPRACPPACAHTTREGGSRTLPLPSSFCKAPHRASTVRVMTGPQPCLRRRGAPGQLLLFEIRSGSPGCPWIPCHLAAQLRFCFECPPRLSPRRSGFTRLNQDGDSAWSDRVHNSRRDPLPRAVTYHLSMSYCRGIYNFWGMSCRPRHGMPPPQNAAVVHNLIHPRES